MKVDRQQENSNVSLCVLSMQLIFKKCLTFMQKNLQMNRLCVVFCNLAITTTNLTCFKSVQIKIIYLLYIKVVRSFTKNKLFFLKDTTKTHVLFFLINFGWTLKTNPTKNYLYCFIWSFLKVFPVYFYGLCVGLNPTRH